MGSAACPAGNQAAFPVALQALTGDLSSLNFVKSFVFVKLHFSHYGWIDAFALAEQIDQLHGFHKIAFGLDALIKKCLAGTFFTEPNSVEEICLHADFQVCLARPWAIENFQGWLTTIEQNLGVWVVRRDANHQIAAGKGCDIGWIGAHMFKNLLHYSVKMIGRLIDSQSLFPLLSMTSK
jgi:hypothetical protein